MTADVFRFDVGGLPMAAAFFDGVSPEAREKAVRCAAEAARRIRLPGGLLVVVFSCEARCAGTGLSYPG